MSVSNGLASVFNNDAGSGSSAPPKKSVTAAVGLVSALASIVGAYMSNRANAKAQSKQNAWSERIQDKQNAFNVAQSNIANAYNSPANQMALFAGAGLNPNLIYGNLQNFGTDAVGSADASGTAPFETANMFADVPNMAMQYSQLQQNQQLVDSQSALLSSQKENQDIANARDRFDLSKQEESYFRHKETEELQIDNMKENLNVMKEQIGILQAQKEQEAEKVLQEILNTQYLRDTLNDRVALVKEQLNLTKEQVEQVKEATNLLILQQLTEVAKQKNLNEEYKKLKVQTEEATARWNHLKEISESNPDILILDEILKMDAHDQNRINLIMSEEDAFYSGISLKNLPHYREVSKNKYKGEEPSLSLMRAISYLGRGVLGGIVGKIFK